MQTQIQVLLVEKEVGERVTERSDTRSNVEVAKPPIFNREVRSITRFITTYKLFLRIKIREVAVEKQIQQILLYVQGGSVDVWKKNILEDLKLVEVEFKLVEEFLLKLKKKFNKGNKELVKIAKLKNRAERKDNREVYLRIQKSSKKKWI